MNRKTPVGLTPKIMRLQVGEATFEARITPQAQPISKNGRIAIRVHFFVSWLVALLYVVA